MINTAQTHNFLSWPGLIEWQSRHPYIFSFLIAATAMFLILFYSSSVEMVDDYTPPEKLKFVDIDQFQLPQRVVKKTISTEKGEISEKKQVDRSKGTADSEKPVDLSFYPNIAPPKLIGRLRKDHPQSAKQRNIEATVFVSLLIDRQGYVRQVHIIGTRLSKDLPPDLHSKISRDFARLAIRILRGARFTPSIVEGKKVPIKMELPLQFRLNK